MQLPISTPLKPILDSKITTLRCVLAKILRILRFDKSLAAISAALENGIQKCMTILQISTQKSLRSNGPRMQSFIKFSEPQNLSESVVCLCMCGAEYNGITRVSLFICRQVSRCNLKRILIPKSLNSQCFVYINFSSSGRIRVLAVCRTILPGDL